MRSGAPILATRIPSLPLLVMHLSWEGKRARISFQDSTRNWPDDWRDGRRDPPGWRYRRTDNCGLSTAEGHKFRIRTDEEAERDIARMYVACTPARCGDERRTNEMGNRMANSKTSKSRSCLVAKQRWLGGGWGTCHNGLGHNVMWHNGIRYNFKNEK